MALFASGTGLRGAVPVEGIRALLLTGARFLRVLCAPLLVATHLTRENSGELRGWDRRQPKALTTENALPAFAYESVRHRARHPRLVRVAGPFDGLGHNQFGYPGLRRIPLALAVSLVRGESSAEFLANGLELRHELCHDHRDVLFRPADEGRRASVLQHEQLPLLDRLRDEIRVVRVVVPRVPNLLPPSHLREALRHVVTRVRFAGVADLQEQNLALGGQGRVAPFRLVLGLAQLENFFRVEFFEAYGPLLQRRVRVLDGALPFILLHIVVGEEDRQAGVLVFREAIVDDVGGKAEVADARGCSFLH